MKKQIPINGNKRKEVHAAGLLDVNGLASGKDRWGYLVCKAHGERLKNCHDCKSARTRVTRIRKPNQALQHSLNRYGVTIDWYNQRVRELNNCCSICHKPEVRKRGGKIARLSVDHNHITNQVRDLLCSRCNMVVGILESSRAKLAEQYLKRYNESHGQLRLSLVA